MLPKNYDDEFKVIQKNDLLGNNYSKLKELSEKYKLSKLALMWRFYTLNIINYSEYKEFKSFLYSNKKKYEGEIKISRINIIKSSKSKKYLNLLNRELEKGNISSIDFREKLKLKNNDQIEEVIHYAK